MVKCLPNTRKVLDLQPFKHTHIQTCMCECAQAPTPMCLSLLVLLANGRLLLPPFSFPCVCSLTLPHPLRPLFFVFRRYPTILHSSEKCGHHLGGAANTVKLTL